MNPNQPNSFGGEAGGNTGSDVNGLQFAAYDSQSSTDNKGDIILVPDAQSQKPKGDKILTTKMKIMLGIVGVMVVALGVLAVVMAGRGKGDGNTAKDASSNNDEVVVLFNKYANYLLNETESEEEIPENYEWFNSSSSFSKIVQGDDKAKKIEYLKKLQELSNSIYEFFNEKEANEKNTDEKNESDEMDSIASKKEYSKELTEYIRALSIFIESDSVDVKMIKQKILSSAIESTYNDIDATINKLDTTNGIISGYVNDMKEYVLILKEIIKNISEKGCVANNQVDESCMTEYLSLPENEDISEAFESIEEGLKHHAKHMTIDIIAASVHLRKNIAESGQENK